MQTRLELYQLVAPLAGLGIWEINLNSGLIYWNKHVREIFEVAEDHVPSSPLPLNFFKQPGYVETFISELKRTQIPKSFEAEITTAQGTHKWVKIRMHHRLETDVSDSLYGTVEDISEEKSFQQQIEQRELRFSQAFNYAPIGMALVSLTGEWLKVNLSLCNLLGYAEQEFLGKTFQDLTYPEDLELDLQQMYLLINGTGDNYSIEKRYFHKDGHIIWALLSVSIVRDEKKCPQYFVSQIKDITERKRSMQIIKTQNERLLNFAHIVSHNIRSYASNIKMLTDMAIHEENLDEKGALLEMLNKSADSLLTTLEELNEVVKLHDTQIEYRRKIYLKKEIEKVISILSALIKKSNTHIQIAIDNDFTVFYSTTYLESLFVNLITNSIKYKHSDRDPCIVIAAETTNDQTLITVSDNGIGIDLNLHGHKLFGMYKTFHNNPDARGMGLFLVKNQIEAMGGTIVAESIPNEGTTFKVIINKN